MYPSPSKYVTNSKDVLQLNSAIVKKGSEIVIYIDLRLNCLEVKIQLMFEKHCLMCLMCFRINERTCVAAFTISNELKT